MRGAAWLGAYGLTALIGVMRPMPVIEMPSVSYCLRAAVRHLVAPAATGVAVCALALAPSAAEALTVRPLHNDALVPQIINGPQTPISSVPWQVFLLEVDEEGEGICGGSILDETHILTAGHCVVDDKTQKTYPAGDFAVIAGATAVGGFFEGCGFGCLAAEPKTAVGDAVSLIRVHPYRNIEVGVDDVAVLTLERPLKLSAADNMQAIALAPAGSSPAAGAMLSVSGYGKQEGVEQNKSTTALHSTTLTALSNDACRGVFISDAADSPVSLCASGSNTATCQGDSGGPLTEGNPAVQVGIVDYGPPECPPGKPDAFVNVAAPEIRDFIEGSESPPTASRSTSLPAIKSVGSAPVDFGPLTCEAGGWSTPPSVLTYTFQTENAAPTALQAGPSNVFTPPASLVGTPLVCIVQAASPGGTATARSATAPAIIADTVPARRVDHRAELHTCPVVHADARRERPQRRGAHRHRRRSLRGHRQMPAPETPKAQEGQAGPLPYDAHRCAARRLAVGGCLQRFGEQAALRRDDRVHRHSRRRRRPAPEHAAHAFHHAAQAEQKKRKKRG